ncbi:uncharacterized mitochondrial protein AtMg00820-like [Vigna angularis]|uniref:uncharacterized mitochondrial protein AtMg00820-like n=1 Tax=Phaseolus angularis TaxID=3914 RepID=UPI00080A2547|nr:uncharacterized mitochondrial protein AtMg00820-like [Vigna angularis]
MMITNSKDPQSYEEACKSIQWREAMNVEMKAIEKNHMWELVDPPEGVTTIGVKWIFKTKFNENGHVEKYKAGLVAKGYAQRYEVDYKKVFALGSRLDIVRILLALAAQNTWDVFQLDLKEKFERCFSEHTLFMRRIKGPILIISLYVDDLIFTRNSKRFGDEFKSSMKREFDITDLGKMRYFLDIEVIQSNTRILICQRQYARDVLERFNMTKSNLV